MAVLAKNDFSTKLMLSWPRKDEYELCKSFSKFNLVRTKFELEYATVKPNRWDNYSLYSNCDLPMIKRINKGH